MATNLDIPDLLERMIQRYNVEALEFERMADYNGQLETQLDSESKELGAITLKADELTAQVTRLNQEVEQLKERNAHLEGQHKADMETINASVTIAKAAVAQKRQLEMTTSNLAATQQELTALKSGGDPKRLREQIKRNKEKHADLTLRAVKLEKDNQEYRREAKATSQLIDALKKELYVASVKSASASYTRLWSDGSQHMVIWPEAIEMQNTSTGKISKGRALLYMHNSGRGGLLTLCHETNQAQMGTAPKGGLRPSKEARDFADAWLYKVNGLQDGSVKVEDLEVTDL